MGHRPEIRAWKLHEYRWLIIGAVYCLLGHGFAKDDRRALTGPLYGFGVMFFLGAGFVLCGWKPNQSYVWEALYPGLVFGVLFLSVFLKSKSFLTFGTLALIGYVGRITMEYFKDSLGWPLSLVLIGFSLMGLGYAAVALNRRYIRTA
jgi:hypothetical protein